MPLLSYPFLQLGVSGKVANRALRYLQGEGLLASGALLVLVLLLLPSPPLLPIHSPTPHLARPGAVDDVHSGAAL